MKAGKLSVLSYLIVVVTGQSHSGRSEKHSRPKPTISIAEFSGIPASSSSKVTSDTFLQSPHDQQSTSVIFPDDASEPVVSQSELKQIPTSLIEALDNADDFTDLLQFLDKVPSFLVGEEADAIEHDGIFRSSFPQGIGAITKMKRAECKPELQTVELMSSNDATVRFFPSCTRIERCSGCCNSDLFSCQPLTQETLFVQVVKMQYFGGKKMDYVGREIVSVEKHTLCGCQCRVKESDCSTSHQYDEGTCRCECINHDDRLKCEHDNQTRYWDNGRCQCRCRLMARCSTGFHYDEDTCQCEQSIARRSDPSITALLGEGGRHQTHHRSRNNEFKKEEESGDKSSRPVQHFHFAQLKKPIG